MKETISSFSRAQLARVLRLISRHPIGEMPVERELPFDTQVHWELLRMAWCNLDQTLSELVLEESHDLSSAPKIRTLSSFLYRGNPTQLSLPFGEGLVP